jgi:hypothetical protein
MKPSNRPSIPKQPASPQADSFKHLRKYEALIETAPNVAGAYYQQHAKEILDELGMIHAQKALAAQTRRAKALPQDEAADADNWMRYASLVNAGHSRKAAEHYARCAESILRGKAIAADDPDDTDDDDKRKDDDEDEGVCGVCLGSGECPECKGHGSQAKKCACSECGGTGKRPK